MGAGRRARFDVIVGCATLCVLPIGCGPTESPPPVIVASATPSPAAPTAPPTPGPAAADPTPAGSPASPSQSPAPASAPSTGGGSPGGGATPPAPGSGATGFDAEGFASAILDAPAPVADVAPVASTIDCAPRAPGFDAFASGPRFTGPVPCSQGFCLEDAPASGPVRTVTGVSSNQLWAVGQGVLLRFDGHRWDTECAPLTGLDLWSSYAAAANDVWVAGTGVLAHWDGARWSSPASPLTQQVPAVWGDARLAFARDFSGSIATWNGTRWAVTYAPQYSFTPWMVWGDGAGHAWAVDDGVRSWDGAGWPALARPTLGGQIFDVNAVWAPAGGPPWVGGYTFRDPDWWTHDAAVARLVDGTFVAVPLPAGSWEVKWIRGSSATNVWVGATSTGDSGGGMFRWDGASWTALPGALPPPALPPLVLGPTDAWVATSTYDASGISVSGIDHFDGASWTSTLALPGAGVGPLAATGPRDVWTISGSREVWRYDGATWRRVLAGFDGGLTAIAVGGDGGAWIAGARAGGGGSVLRWDGSSFRETPFASRIDHLAARGGDAWAAEDGDPSSGASAVVHHWDGAAWHDLDTGVAMTIAGLWASSADDLWLVGAVSKLFTPPVVGVLLHHDGTRWQRHDLSGYAPRAVWGSGPDDVWIGAETATCGKCPPVAPGATTLHWDGHRLSHVADLPLASVSGTGPGDAWGTTFTWPAGASGPEASVFHFDGSRWSRVARLLDPFRVTTITALAGGEIWGTDGQRVLRRRAPAPR